jgi:hypothetical protein
VTLTDVRQTFSIILNSKIGDESPARRADARFPETAQANGARPGLVKAHNAFPRSPRSLALLCTGAFSGKGSRVNGICSPETIAETDLAIMRSIARIMQHSCSTEVA